MFKVHSKNLLIIASAVWIVAGANILRMGIAAMLECGGNLWLEVIGIACTFLAFHVMFGRLLGKHASRIRDYGNERIHFFKFFDLKGYLIIALMMGMGILLRELSVFPEWFVAFFYTGLGAALVLAGMGFGVHYMRRGGDIVCPVTKKRRLA